MPLFGPPNVRCLRSTRNVKGLIRALTYQKDRDVRVAAAEPRDERAVQALTQTLAADEPYLRINGARALGEAGQPDAVEPLIGLLSDDDMHVTKAAADALGRSGDPRAVGPLIGVIRRFKDVYSPEAAAEAMGRIGGPSVIEPLTRTPQHEKDAVRTAAAAALRKIENEELPGPRKQKEV